MWTEKERVNNIIAFLSSIAFSAIGLYISNKRLPGYMSKSYIAVIGLLFCIMVYVLIGKVNDKWKRMPFLFLLFFSLMTGLYVRPVSKGLDSIYSKPAYGVIRTIMENDPEAKWFTQGNCLSGFLVASGAPCIDFVNKYPNIELWKKLDSKREFEECYNRFAYISISLTDDETDMNNPKADVLQVNLSYKDIIKTGVNYVATTTPLEVDNEYVAFKCIYQENGLYFYSIIYKVKIDEEQCINNCTCL